MQRGSIDYLVAKIALNALVSPCRFLASPMLCFSHQIQCEYVDVLHVVDRVRDLASFMMHSAVVFAGINVAILSCSACS